MEKNPASRIYEDPEIGEIVFRKSRRCGPMSIRVHPVRSVAVSLPYLTCMRSSRGLRQYAAEKRNCSLIFADIGKECYICIGNRRDAKREQIE